MVSGKVERRVHELGAIVAVKLGASQAQRINLAGDEAAAQERLHP